MKLSEICIQKPILATMMNLVLVLLGIIGISRLPVRELPDIDPPIVNVQTTYPGASASVVEIQITEPIEDVLTSVEGIKKMVSESREQSSSITLEFDLSRDVDLAAQDVRDRVARARGRLPDDIEEPIVSKQDADASPSIWIALYSDRYSPLELTTLAESMFKDRLQTVPGVSSVILGGSKRFAIRIWLDSDKMAARKVTFLDVEKALQEQSIELPSGKIESWEREMSIETRGELKTPEEYNDMVIKQEGANFIRLRDIGYAKVGVEDEQSRARFNSRPALGLGIIKQSKANIIDVAHGIKEELEKIKPLMPEGVITQFAYDESIYIEKSIHEVWITLGLAFILVVITIYIFLHTFRATSVPAITIPVSIIATFAVLYAMGFSINIITMLAFILSIGLVVDDAIIVLENIHRHIEEGMQPMEAAVVGMKEISFAVIATSVALISVFLPLAFQTSDTGRLFIEFAIAISFSVIISTFVALTLAPSLSARLLKQDVHKKKGFSTIFENWMNRQTARYTRMLSWSLRHKLVIIILSVVTFLGAVFFYKHLDKEFLPDEDKGRLFCIILAPEGSTSEYTDRMVGKVEDILSKTPEVSGYFAAVALSRGGPGKGSEGLSFIRLKDGPRAHVRDIVGGPQGLAGKFFGGIEGALVIPIIPKAIGGGFSQPFQLVLQGQELDKLNKFSQDVVQALSAAGFLMNVRSTYELTKPELRIEIDRNRAAALGVSIGDISRTLQVLFGGSKLANLNLKGKEYDVIVQLERESRLTPQQLEKLYVPNNKGDLIQLSNIIKYEIGGGASKINHFNRFRSATIEAMPMGIPIGEAADRAEKIIRPLLPEGFRYEWDGEVADLRESGNEIFFVILLALAVIYMVLAAQFESLADPFIIMLTIPLAACGAFGSLWVIHWFNGVAASASWTWFPFIPAMNINLFSQIGLVMLIGIVTKNGILLVEFANQQLAKGKDPLTAMLEAARIRFRPILMTAFSTIAGTLPIAIGFGAGAESRRPMGVVVVGGLATSTFLTLFLIPVVYVLFHKIASRKKARQSAVTVLLISILSVHLSGCMTVGPDFVKPSVNVPADWKLGSETEHWKKASPDDHVSRIGWWEIFEDSTLNDLEAEAVNSNHTLEGAMANFNQARAVARIEKAEFFPEVNLNPSAERFRLTKNSFTSTSASVNSFISERYEVPFDLSYEIDLWGRVRRSFEASQAEAMAAYDHYQVVLLSLTSEVARIYFSIRELDKEVEVIDETIKLRQYAVDVVTQRVQVGVTNELDLNRAKTELAQVQSDRVDVLRRRMEFVNALAVLCGQPATDFDVTSAPLPLSTPKIPVGLPSTLLERRPDIAEAQRDVWAANARIGIAKAAFFPTLTLTGSAGFASIQTDNLFDWESRVWSIGPGVSLPVFAGGRNRANLEATLAAYDETVADYRQAALQAFSEAETALHNIALGHDHAVAQEKVLSSARDAAKLSFERYKQGLVTFLEVIDTERSRLDAELEATQILSRRLIDTVLLIKALGGGWE